MRASFAVAFLLSLSGLELQAQVERLRQVSAAECQAVIDSLNQSPTPPATSTTWEIVAYCGEAGGRSLAHAIGSLTQETDSATIAAAEWETSAIRDSSVFEALRSLASDGSAPPQVRLLALNSLLAQVSHWMVLSKPLETPLDTPGACLPHIASEGWLEAGTPLPANHPQLLLETATGVLQSDSPASVKNAARCFLRLIHPLTGPQVELSKFTLSYVCGRKFKIQNSNAEGVTLAYVAGEHADSASFQAPGAKDTYFVTAVTGTVRVYLGKQLLQTQANNEIPCPPRQGQVPE